mmetsp:Transcript_10018/g.17728  ORF Transcript_10018/g.17728 Transcript_10018/m.17728 type:complete len:287 (+) Transcript_10018:1212-2072(+)
MNTSRCIHHVHHYLVAELAVFQQDDYLQHAAERTEPVCLLVFLGSLELRRVEGDTNHSFTEVGADLRQFLCVLVIRARVNNCLGALNRVARLEDTRSNETTINPQLHHHGDVGRRCNTTGGERDHGQTTQLSRLLDQVEGALVLFGKDENLVFIHTLQTADLLEDLPGVSHGLDQISCTSLTLHTDHTSTFSNTAQSLTQGLSPTNKRNTKLGFVDVVVRIRRCQHLALVDVIDSKSFQDLGLGKMADAGFGHNRNGTSLHNLLDHRRVTHPGHASICNDICRNPF